MAEFPRLDFYPDAYLADTAHLSIAEAGAYTNLLWIAWRIEDGGLPTDDAILARYARASRREWRAVKSRVLAFFTLCGDGKLRQKRLELEREAARKRSEHGTVGARAMWLKRHKTISARAMPELSPGYAQPLLEACPIPALHQPSTINHHRVSANADTRARSKGDPEGFAEWWGIYPRKIGKGQARKAYASATKKLPPADLLSATRLAVERFNGTEIRFIPHPATWLNGERWADEAPHEEATPTPEDFRRIIAEQRAKGP